MPIYKPGTLCEVRGLSSHFASGMIVEVVRYIGDFGFPSGMTRDSHQVKFREEIAGKQRSGDNWSTVWTDVVVVPTAVLIPISGPDIDLSDEDILLYEEASNGN